MVSGGQESFYGKKKFLQGLLIRFSGVNRAAQQLAASDLSDITIRHMGGSRKLGDLCDLEDCNALNELTAYLKGSILLNSAVGGAFSGTIWYPFDGLNFGMSSTYLGEKERIQVRLGAVSSVVIASGTFQIRAVWTDDGETKVVPYFREATLSAAGDQYLFPGFTAMVVVGDPGAGNRPEIQLTRGNEVGWEGDWQDFLEDTKIFGSYDGATDPTLPVIDLSEGNRDRRFLFGETTIKLKDGLGAANTRITSVHLNVDAVRHAASIQARETFTARAVRSLSAETASSQVALAVIEDGETTSAPILTDGMRRKSAVNAGL